MKRVPNLSIITAFIVCFLPYLSKATGNKSCTTVVHTVFVATDTVPAVRKSAEDPAKVNAAAKPGTDAKPVLPGKQVKAVIKQVPRARKVDVPVKVKVVKPKIIKPAVKII